MTTIEIERDGDEPGHYSGGDEQLSEHEEEHQDEEQPGHDSGVEQPAYKWTSKPVKQLSKSERDRLIEDFEKGTENVYFKVNRLKNGGYRINKRSNPLVTDATEAPAKTAENISKKYDGKQLTTEQLLLEHMFELERKYEIMRMKHKKLKKRYNKLEDDIFESDDEQPVEPVHYGGHEVQEPVEQPVRPVREQVQEPVKQVQSRSNGEQVTFRRPQKRTWRTMLNA
jgi:hypothetical protein